MISRAFTSGRRMVVVGVLMLASALVLAACGGGSSGSGSTSPAAASATAGAAGGGAAGGGAGRPGAAGQIAAITGTTMQVQSQQAGQVGVSWTASTTFSHPVTTTLSAIKAGDCVVATAPTGSSSTSFTATALSVTTPVNGQCGGGAGGPGGQRPTGQRPSGAPSGGFGQRTGAFATGTVSSVSGSTLVIAARQPGSTGTTTNRTVTTDAQTKVTTQQSTNSQALKVGLCVTAQGSADSNGTVAATSVRISNPVNGQCTVGGFGGGNNGG